MIAYYRRLIPSFDKLAHPLYDLLRDKSDRVWWPEHSDAVQKSKDALAEETLLRVYDPDKPVTIKTDASKYAVGAV